MKALLKAPGNSYLVESRGLLRFASTPVDMTVIGPTSLLLVPAGMTVVVTEVLFNCTTAANVASPATARIDATSGVIFSGQELVGLLATNDLFRFPVGGTGTVAGPGESVFATIDVPATGASVSQTAQIELVGYLV